MHSQIWLSNEDFPGLSFINSIPSVVVTLEAVWCVFAHLKNTPMCPSIGVHGVCYEKRIHWHRSRPSPFSISFSPFRAVGRKIWAITRKWFERITSNGPGKRFSQQQIQNCLSICIFCCHQVDAFTRGRQVALEADLGFIIN